MNRSSKLDIKAGLLTLAFILFVVIVIIGVTHFPFLAGMILAVLASVLTISSIFIIIRTALG